jgi:acyl transferase domain-containing protein/NADP-dependent 3-hydroxy acid dehydrogenase YdfG/acyl carrier protein
MTDFSDKLAQLSQKQLMVLALQLNERLERSQKSEPIAVIGMACRFPGADSPEEYWQLLDEGRDTTREMPADRWDMDVFYAPDPEVPGKIAARRGGYLDDVAGFDAGLFGVSPREALSMDPQQRLMLETSWQALERAGLAPEGLAGANVGIFLGLCNSDHFLRMVGRGLETLDNYVASGNAPSVAAGRIAYTLGFSGPAITVDTACSSSLVALQMACRSLRANESRIALAAGVNVICAPETAIALSRGRMLAPDGRCKSFDASADGFARGEGCGVLVLKRLSDARAEKDPILAVIRGAAVNQDGRSGGLTVPSGPAQQAVITAALTDAGLQPADIDYVEAHGTGTSLGDPIEVRALAAVYGPGRATPLLVGSAKSNLGHLESAAGIAGVMKVILALRAGRLPKSLHFSTPNPHIPWNEIPVEVVAKNCVWPRRGAPRRAGISSFGFSGTNAHVIVEEAPAEQAAPKGVERPCHVIPISAQSDGALRRIAANFAASLRTGLIGVADAAHTAGVGRSHLVERAAVVAKDACQAAEALQALADGAEHPRLHRGRAPLARPTDVVFMFSGQGGQHPGMAKDLYAIAPVFRAELDRCSAILGPDAQGRTLLDVMLAPPGDEAIHDTAWTQPVLFALQCGLVALWAAWGVKPAAVIGHSLGEYAAAYAAGAMSLEDGLELVATRGKLCAALPPGAMAAIYAPLAEVEAEVTPRAARLSIAAVNGPESIVISGEKADVEAVISVFNARHIRTQLLKISMAAHSPLTAGALAPLAEAAAKVEGQAVRVPVAWNLTGGAPLPDNGAPDADYWRRHLAEPVRFADGLAELTRQGFVTFLEIGPHPTLTALAQSVLSDEARVLHSLRRDEDDWTEMSDALAHLYAVGAQIDWAGVDAPYPARKILLPTYAFDHRRYWVDAPAPGAARSLPVAASLVGRRLDTPILQREVRLTPDFPAYLRDHQVGGRFIAPGPLLIEIAQTCVAAEFGQRARAVKAFEIFAPIVVAEEGVSVHVALEDGGFILHARGVDGAWTRCAAGRFDEAPSGARPTVDLAALQKRLGGEVDLAAHHQALQALGIVFGPAFRLVECGWRGKDEALAKVAGGANASAFAWPPALDAALQAIGLSSETLELRLFSGLDGLWLSGELPATFFAHAILDRSGDEAELRADVRLYDEAGREIGALNGVTLRRESAGAFDPLCYRVDWVPVGAAASSSVQLPSPDDCVSAAEKGFAELAEAHDLWRHHDELGVQLDRLTLLHIAEALRSLGFDDTPGRRFDLEVEGARLGVASRHVRTFRKIVDLLVDNGICARDGDCAATISERLPVEAADPFYPSLIERFDPASGELRLLRRCGGSLAEALCDRVDPAALLFPDGSFEDARRLYDDAPSARTLNGTLAAALRAAVEAAPADTRLRVLEIGAGTGATSAAILEALPPGSVDYTFTDVSPVFLQRAAERFSHVQGMRFGLLDIEQDPASQGFAAGEYDIVLAANAIHATRDLRASVRHASTLLARGGWLALIEGVADDPWVELTFGLTTGWRRYEDLDLRPSSPLIDREGWKALLADEAFDNVQILPDGARPGRATRQQALILARAGGSGRCWRLVSASDDPLVTALSAILTARGDMVVQDDPNAHLVYLSAAALTDADTATAAQVSCLDAIETLSAFVRRGEGRAYLVTRGAQAVEGEQASGARWQAPLWGVGRVFALESPGRWGGLIDLPPQGDVDAQAAILAAALDARDGEDQVAIRRGRRFAARIAQAEPPPASQPVVREGATYLVTGGFGGVGRLVGQWLAEQGAGDVALMGRTAQADHQAVREIEALGARVHVVAADVADEASLAAALEELSRRAPPLAGIFHAAADFGVATIADADRSGAKAVLRPKLDGLIALERATAANDLDFLVLFSSTTALLGASGYAAYAAANAFFDASAETAPSGRRTLSIRWGTWEAMRLASDQQQDAYRAAGLEPLPKAEALELMGRALGGGAATPIFAKIDWSRLKPLHEAKGARPFLSAMEAAATEIAVAGPTAKLIDRLRDAAPDQREQMLLDFVAIEVATVLETPPDAPPSYDAGLFELGMDSLMSVELKRRLERGFGAPLPSTLTFNYPNIRALAGFLENLVASAGAAIEPEPEFRSAIAPVDDQNLDALTDEEIQTQLMAVLEETK